MLDTTGNQSYCRPKWWNTFFASAFVLFYLYALGFWLLPPSSVRERFLKPIKPLIEYCGLWQTYVVFAPNPRTINSDLEARISFSDGSTEVWKYPRVESYGLVERISQERFRKFGYDHLNEDKGAVLRPDLARYVARLYDSPTRHPVLVKLVRHWAVIPPPEEGIGKPLPPHLRFQVFLIYQVRPADLL
jgi:hypothetical protein